MRPGRSSWSGSRIPARRGGLRKWWSAWIPGRSVTRSWNSPSPPRPNAERPCVPYTSGASRRPSPGARGRCIRSKWRTVWSRSPESSWPKPSSRGATSIRRSASSSRSRPALPPRSCCPAAPVPASWSSDGAVTRRACDVWARSPTPSCTTPQPPWRSCLTTVPRVGPPPAPPPYGRRRVRCLLSRADRNGLGRPLARAGPRGTRPVTLGPARWWPSASGRPRRRKTEAGNPGGPPHTRTDGACRPVRGTSGT